MNLRKLCLQDDFDYIIKMALRNRVSKVRVSKRVWKQIKFEIENDFSLQSRLKQSRSGRAVQGATVVSIRFDTVLNHVPNHMI